MHCPTSSEKHRYPMVGRKFVARVRLPLFAAGWR